LRDQELALYAEVGSYTMKATPVSAPPPKPKVVELSPTDEYKKGLEDIGKQLVDLADYLPLIK